MDIEQEAISSWVSPLGTSAEHASRDREGRSDEYRRLREQYAGIRKFARQVIRLRSELGMTQQELAARAGTSYSQVSRLESGRHKPNFATIERIATALGCEVHLELRGPLHEGREEFEPQE